MRFPSALVGLCCSALLAAPAPAQDAPVALRVATFNLEDVRTEDLLRTDHPRLRALAAVIQQIRPNVILLNEIAYDEPGAPAVPAGAPPGQNAQRFLDHYLSRPQLEGVDPIRYRAFAARSNTGLPSGLDLDRSGEVVDTYPPPPPGTDDRPGPQTDEGRAYGNDCWGFGTFPGQYAMALLVDERLTILSDEIRTFRLLPWAYMPNALLPAVPESLEPDPAPTPSSAAPADAPPTPQMWYADATDRVRLSSKSHWDVPIRLPNGAVVHVLASHPTPPAFDGPEQRNHRRNHDEIRFWADYVEGAQYLVDDASRPGALAPGASFVILGDLNADPDEGTALHNPIESLLLASPRVLRYPAPVSDIVIDRLDPDDTARFRLRVDYVLPSSDLTVLRSGVWRRPPTDGPFPSDHFPVWVDLAVPAPSPPRGEPPKPGPRLP